MSKEIIVERGTKTVYREGSKIIKQFKAGYPKSAVIKEAFNHALAEESGLNVPALLEVKNTGEGWALPVRVSVPDELLMVPMDATLIEQVLINLMENAIQHGGTTTRVELQLQKDGERARFEVADDGQGIAREVFPKLFKGYLSHDEGLTADGRRNMGIGLSVCMSIVRAHGGTMKAENRATGGACVSFALPMEEE